jgi:hypothetical protein
LSTTDTKFAGSSTGAYVVPHAEVPAGELDAHGDQISTDALVMTAAAIPAITPRFMVDLLSLRLGRGHDAPLGMKQR